MVVALSKTFHHDPIFTLRFSSCPIIFIVDHSLAHQALLLHGAAFADRPPATTTTKILYSNLISQILHPSRLKLLSHARRFTLQSLVSRLNSYSTVSRRCSFCRPFLADYNGAIRVYMFRVEDPEERIKTLSDLLHRVLFYSNSQNKLNQYPLKLGKFFYPNLWNELSTLRNEMETAIIPLIKARFDEKQREIEQNNNELESERILPYLDTLINLHLPKENRKLEDGEIISLCAEFLNEIVHSTMVVMQWAMANIMKSKILILVEH